MRIAIPRALHHYDHYPHWKTFLEALGHDVVRTRRTDRRLLDRGVELSLSDICLPFRVYLAHAEAAATLADAVFIPLLVSVRPTHYYCPKFLAMVDLVRTKVPSARILTVEINAKKGPDFTRRSFLALARELGADEEDAQRALMLADEALTRSREANRERAARELAAVDGSPRILVIGRPYELEDPAISAGVVDWLRTRDVHVLTAESIPEAEVANTELGLDRDPYWECSATLMAAAVAGLTRPEVDGTILVSAFACGPDSVISDIIARRARAAGSAPFVRLLIDEHAARTGVETRLEAFLDMVHAVRGRRAGSP